MAGVGLNLLDGLFKGLEETGIDYVVYDGVQPNPTIDNIEAALELYKTNGCEGIVAFGGGSPMDCAKASGATVAPPANTCRTCVYESICRLRACNCT